MSNEAATVENLPQTERDAALIEKIEAMIAGGTSQGELAKQAGISPTTLSQYLRDLYTGSITNVEEKLRRVVEINAQRQRMPLPIGPGYVETPTSRKILATLSYAHLAGDIAVIYGGAGLGKTSTLKYYAHEEVSVWLATMTAATAQPVTALEEICHAIGLRDAHGGASKLQRLVIRRVSDTSGLLIIDEAQHLSPQALEVIRAIHDATGLGIVMVGNETVYTRLTGGNRAAGFAQLFSRIGKRTRLNATTDADVEAVLDGWDIRDPEVRDLAKRIARSPGALRGLDKTLKLAGLLANQAGRKIGASHVRSAWKDLGGE